MLILWQILFEHHIPRMSNASTSNETNTWHSCRSLRQMHAHTVQSHALRFPVRQRPRQRQRIILSSHLFFHSRRHLLPEDWYPITSRAWYIRGRVIREEAARPPISINAQIHRVELDKNTNRRPQCRVLTMWIPTRFPHVATKHAKRTIHQTSLYPKILSKQNARTHTETQLILHPSKIICVHFIRFHSLPLRSFGLIMVRPHRQNRSLRFRRQRHQLPFIHLVCPNLTGHTRFPTIHQKRCIPELRNLLPPFLGLLQTTPVLPTQPGMILSRPGAICHSSGHI